MPRRQIPPLLFLACVSSLVTADDRVVFNRDIRPILSENCFYCHGFDAEHREAELRLDTFEGATESGVMIPGEPDESELLRRLLTDDKDEVMPPPETEKHLTPKQTELVRRWIQQGAEYQEHWAWQSLERPQSPPTIEAHSMKSNTVPSIVQTAAAAVDAFLAAGWREHEVSPAADATPREKLRRLSFDLRGLAPTIEDVRAFESDPTDKALFRFRERWMSELSFAEHQAVRWLDLVRWADTSGFVSDEPIASGAYRAWIIKSFRDNQRFDEFSRDQLAGDLLPASTDDQLTASGYNRIVNTNCEAGAIETEQLYKLKGEHVRALGTVWLGLTTGCAECHDHKFDPLSAKDYYSLAAFFDDLVEAGVYTPGDQREPLHYVHDDPESSRIDRELASEIETLKSEIAGIDAANAGEQFDQWQQRTRTSLENTKQRSDFVWASSVLPAARILEGEFQQTVVESQPVRETKSGNDLFRRHHAAEFMTGYVTVNSVKADAVNDAWYVDVWLDESRRPKMIGFQVSFGDYGRLGWQTSNYETYYWGDDVSGELAKPQSWSDPARVKRIGDLPQSSGWVRLRVPLQETFRSRYKAVGMAWLQSGGRVLWGNSGLELRADKVAGLELGEVAMRKWWDKPWNRQVYQRRMEFVVSALKSPAAQRDPLQHEIVADAFREAQSPVVMKKLRQAEGRLYSLRSQAMRVLVSRQADRRKITRVLHRGDYQDESGPIVTAAVPEFLGQIDQSSTKDDVATRLDLADWMFGEGHPMIARVYVNRLWHQFYGRGLSETLEDSGTQGDWPSHPDLLDWLACEFRDSGWDRNHMIRVLTTTQAYQMSSTPTEQMATRDPNNRWHARQSRHRRSAEEIRDAALQTAGLLQVASEIPTHSFFPYQPDPYWTRSDKVMYGSRHMIWETSANSSQYSRSLYTFWKRQNVHPTMLAFDAPTRQECTAKRNITNTPGQALTLLNDPIFVEAACVFAIRLTEASDSEDLERIARAYKLALQRTPTSEEIEILNRLLNNQRAWYQDHPKEAVSLLAVGQQSTASSAAPAEIAAWMAVTRAILNLHEFLNRS